MPVNNNKGQYLISLQNGESEMWNDAQYAKRRDQLFNDFPTATATRVQDYNPEDNDIQDTDSFFVQVGDENEEWDAATFNHRKDQLFADFPQAKVKKLRRDDYWGEQGDEQRRAIAKRLDEISVAEKSIHDAANEEFKAEKGNKSFLGKLVENISSAGRANSDPFGYADSSTYQGWLNTTGREKYGNDLKNYQAAEQTLKEAQELQNELLKDDAKGSDSRLKAFIKGNIQGQKKYVNDIESWNQIVAGENAAAMYGLQQKIEKIIEGVDDNADGTAIEKAIQDGLTPSERSLFDAIQASGSVTSSLQPKIAGSVKAGEVMAASERMGLEFLLFNGIAGAANRGVARNVEKYLTKRLVKDGAGKVARKLGTTAAKVLAADTGALVGGGIQTTLGPSNWSGIAKNAEDTMQAFLSSPAAFMNPETRAQYGIEGPKAMGELALDGAVQYLTENATEFGLGPVNKLLGGLGKAGYRGLRKMGWNNLATLLSPKASAFLNKAGIGNLLEETGEEVNGAIIDYFSGNKDALKDFGSMENLGILMASFVPTIGVGAGVSAIQRGVYNNRYNKAADAYRQYLLDTKAVNTVDEANDIINSLNVETPEELGRRAGRLYQALDQRQGGDKATEATLLTNLITATRNRSLANGVNQLMLEESRGDTRDNIMDNTKGRQFWQTREADMVDEGGTPYKGEEEFVDFLTTDGDNNFFIRKEDEDGNIETVDENGTVRRFTADEVERGLADGTFTGRRTMDMNDYLDERSGIQRDKVWQVSSERVSQMASYEGAVAQGSQSIQDVAYDAQQSLATLGKEALEMGVEADELENSSNDIAHAAFEARQNGNVELANTLSAYADAKATVEGLHEGYISGRQQRAEAAIDNQINTYGHDGEMVGATLGDKTVFIQSKDVKVARDGSVVVLGGSANSKVQIIDPVTGETRLVSPAELSGAWSAPVDEYRQNGISVLMEDAEQEYNTAVNTMSHSAMAEAVTPLVGHTAILTNENGEASPVTVVAVNPQAFTATVRDGSRKGQMNEVGIDVLYNQLQKNADGSIVLDATATNNKVEAQPEAQQPQQAPAQQPAAQSDVPINNYRGKVMLNGELRDVQVTEVDRDGTVQYDLLDSDGEAVGSAETDTPTFRAMIAAAQAPAPAQEVSEAPATQPETPAEPKTPVERYTDPKTGKVNQKDFMDNEPAEWAKWNDERRGDNGENSRKRLTAAINALDAEIPSRQAELDNEPDPDVAEEKETALNDIKARRARFNAVLESYNAPVVEEATVAEEVAEEPAEQPVEEAVEPEAHAEEPAPAEEPEAPVAPEVEEQPVVEEPAVEETPVQAEETNVPEAETEAETPVEETVEEPEAAEETPEETQTIEEVEAELVEEGLKPHDSLISRFIQSIQRLISTKAKALGKLNLYNYTSSDELRPAMQGVYHKDGNAYATDSFIVIVDKDSYDKKNDGKIIGKDGKVISGKYPEVISGKNPDVPSVFKDIDKWQKEKIDFAELREFLAGMKAQLEAEWKEKKEKGETFETRKKYVNDAKVLLNLDTDITSMVKFELLSKFADYAERIGAKEIRFQDDRHALGVKTDKGMALVMPRYKNDYLSNVGRSNEETAREANENDHIYSFGENGVMKRFDKAFKERGAARKKEEERQKKLVKRAEKWKKYIGDSFALLSSEDDIRNMDESAANIEEALNAVRNGDHGWYGESSDKAYIYLPNIKDEAELDRKIMHEVLTHKGLLHLLGREQYDNLLDEVWDSMNEAQRAWAQNYYDRSQFSSDEAHRRAGTEEFLAKVAEKDESIAAIVDENFWTKFVEKVKEFINKMLEEPVFTNEVKGTWMSNYLMNSFVNLAAEKQRSEATAKAEEAPQAPVSETKEKYEDFGEKIGYARKDLATPTGKKGEADNRPAWVKKYNVVNVRVLSPEVAAIVAREGVRPFEELPTSITEGVDYNQPFVAYYEKKSKYGGTYKHYITDANRKPMVFTSKDQYEAALPVFEAKDQGYRVREDGGKFKIVRPASNGKLVEYAEFDTKEEAVAYLASPEGATDVLNRKRENYELPALSALTRNGMPDYRNGKDVTPQDILDTFGFRGGEFGNWLNAEERQQFLNYAYDALMDLANLIGVSPKALSLGGELSIAFGARGKGGALAHYEPDLVVVNLTKMKGAGSLAHEWAHALDNYFGIQDSKKVREREYGSGKDAIYITEGTTFRQGTRKEVRDAFREVMKTLTKKTVTRKIELEDALAVLEQTRKWYDSQVESEREDLERGRTTRKYNRKTKEYDTVKYTLTDEQLAQFDDLLKQLETDPTFKWEYDWGKGGFRASGEVAEKLYDLVKDIMPNRKETYGPLNNVFYNLYRRVLPAEERVRAAREGLSETVTVDTDLVKESQWFDRGRASSYWATPVEMFARAFEAYLANRMDEQGKSSDYLTYMKAPLFKAMWEHTPYPQGEELKTASDAFSKLFDTIQEKTDENGRTILFSRAFHGSTNDFDQFDLFHIGEGEGNQAHGYGHYVSLGEGTAKRYSYLGERDRVTYRGDVPPTYYAGELVGGMEVEMRNGEPFEELKARIVNMLKRVEANRENADPYWRNVSNAKEIEFIEGLTKDDFDIKEVGHNLYTVEIPDDNGENYIDEDKNVKKPLRVKIADALRALPEDQWKISEDEALLFRDYTKDKFADKVEKGPIDGRSLYVGISHGLGSDKAASEFLSNSGFVGMKYDGRFDGPCAVIFSDDDIKIVDHLKFSKKATITPEMDAAYLDAVEAGDMETAERLVREAAAIAMPETKVVDSDGMPRVVYHGTKHKFWVFDGGKSRAQYTDGLNYFSLDRQFSEDWIHRMDEWQRDQEDNEKLEAERLKSLEHKREMVKPLVEKYGNKYWDTDEYREMEKEFDQWERDNLDLDGMTEREAQYNYGKRLLGCFINAKNPYNPTERYESEGRQMLIDLGELEANPTPMSEMYARGGAYIYYEKKNVIDELKRRGYDAIYLSENVWSDPSKNLRTIGVWDANQIKLADPVTYDDNGNVIPLSERFNEDNPDIRFREAVGPVARLAEAEREVVDRKLDEMGSTLGIPVNRVSRDQMPKGHEYDKGYYDPQTGEMYICMDNVAGINDAVATVLHESVGHLGLRRLLGDRFASTMQQIYAALDEKGRTWVNHYIATHNEAPATRAVEEYLSHLAESGDFMTTERSVWQQIKDIIARAIDAVFGTDFFSFTDDELNYILRASYENLQNPNWLNTVEGWAKDNLMRATLGFNSFNPEQMEDDEILFREKFTPIGNAADDYDQRVKLNHNKMVTEVQNLNRPVQIAYEEVMKETGKKKITEAEDYIQRAEQAGSRAQTEQDAFWRDYATPILDQVLQIQSILLKKARSRAKEDANDTIEKSRKKRRIREYERILDYLYAVSALERNRYKNAELAEQKKNAIEEAETKAEEKRAKVRAEMKDEAQADALAKIDNDLRNELAEIEERYAPRDWSGLTSLEGVYDNNALNALRPKPTDNDKRRAELKKQREALRRSWWPEAERRAEERIERMRRLVGDEQLNRLWDLIRNATDFNLQHALDHGLLTKEEFDRLHGTEETPRMWEYYLPLRGFTEETAEQQYDYSHIANGNGGSAVVRKMNGRWSEADNPLANLFNIAQREIAQGWDNWAKMALYRFALNSGENSLLSVKEAWYEKNPETGEWELAQPRADETMDEFENRMQSLKENRQEDGTKGKPLAKKGRRGLELNKIRGSRNGSNEHIIRLKVAGQDKVIWVNGDPAMAKAVNGTSRGHNMALIRRASRALSNLFTTYSLNFSIKNLFRDTIYSQLVLRVKESRSYRHKYYKNWIRNIRFLAGPMVRLSRQYENGTLQKKPNLTERERLFIDFMNDGGATGYSIVNSVDTIKRDIERSMRRGGKEVSKYRVPLLGHYAEAVKTLNEGFELLTRFTAYETSRQVGRSGQRAAADAKEISVNFNRRGAQSGEGFWGTVAAYFGATHYFFNAGVQGFDNFMNLIKTKPAKMTRFMAEFMLLGFLTPLINSMLAGMLDDDEDENYDWYWELPQWVRRNNLVMGYRGYYFAIPLSVEVRALYGMGDIAAMVAFSKYAGDNGFNVGLDAMSTAMGILPINPVEDYTASGNFSDTAIRNLAPDIMMPLVDIATNRDYTGRPLSKENPFTHNTPKSQAAFASTPKYLVKACQAIAKATATAPIHIDPNPGVWRDIFKSYGGGFYKTAEDVAKITMIDTDHPFRWDNMPFMSGFTGHLDEDRSNSFEIDALNAYKEISEDVVRRLNSVTGGGVTPAIAFKDPESLPDIAQAQIILEGKKYQLAKTYYDGMRNVYKINPKTGKEYTSGAKNLAHKGVNKLYDEWKALYDEWKLMPNASNSEKEAKAAKTLAVQQAWNLYRNAQGNLVDILLEMENGERLSGLEADAYELTKGLVF